MTKPIHSRRTRLLLPLFVLISSAAVFAQPSLQLPRTSQGATVTQRIGVTDVTISYHRPGVKGRTVWGGLVPFNEMWRVGANEKATITVSDPVEVGGTALPAGTYALHMMPAEGSVTIVFSKDISGWGTQYDAKDDVLRIDAPFTPAPATEWMEFTFTGLSDTGATIALRWADRSVGFPLTVRTPEVVLEHARKEFAAGTDTSLADMLRQAAAYAHLRNIHLDEALSWIDRSLAVKPSFQSLCVKADILSGTAKDDLAAQVLGQAVGGATPAEAASYARQLRRDGRAARALELLGKIDAGQDGAWEIHLALGETHEALKDTDSARKEYNAALEGAPEGTGKERILELLKGLDDRK